MNNDAVPPPPEAKPWLDAIRAARTPEAVAAITTAYITATRELEAQP